MAKVRKPQAKLLDDGTLMLFGAIGDEWEGLTAAAVVEEIRSLGNVQDIEVLINSPGGSVTEGLAIYNELATHPAHVTVEIAGLAASMGSAIAMAGDTVRIAANGMIMIHNPWNVAVGDSAELRKAADMLDKFGTSLVGIYATKTGLDPDEIREMMDEETWLDATEALAKGFVDEVVGPVEVAAFADLDISELTAVPAALTRLIQEGRTMAKIPPKTPAAPPATDPATPPATTEPAGATTEPVGATPADVTTAAQAAAEAAVRADRERTGKINALAAQFGMTPEWAAAHVASGAALPAVHADALEVLAKRQEAAEGPGSWTPNGVTLTQDDRDKFVTGAAAWLAIKAGRSSLVEKHTGETLNPGEFRGMSLLDLAHESLRRSGVSTRGLGKMEVARAALHRGPQAAGAGLGTRSDFPVLLENVLHKMLLASYGTTPDTWRAFCAETSVSDFRPHPRLRIGSFGQLDTLLESGELKQKHFPDAEKETISATTRGNIVGLTRQAIVNDDVDGFSRLVTMLGRAAALSIEVDVYALLALNSGLGPTMADGDTLFFARTNGNSIGTGAALSGASVDLDRVVLASQKDEEGNEFLDLRPSVLLVPLSLGSTARTINDAQYDPDTAGALTPNVSRGLFEKVVDTARLTGTRRYMFADPAMAPVLEVAFLDGMSSPVLDVEEGFEYDGIKWNVRFDYGVGATATRGAVTNAGTT